MSGRIIRPFRQQHPAQHGKIAQPGDVHLEIPAAKVAIWGEAAQFHIDRHAEKLRVCPFDCGIDLFPLGAPPEVMELNREMERINIHTGVHIVIPPAAFGMIHDRSSTPVRLKGATTFGGTIDAGYTGEIKVHVHCTKSTYDEVAVALADCVVNKIAIAQLIICSFWTPIFQICPERPVLQGRGDKGYGSTDKPSQEKGSNETGSQ